jgi:hypothetical protein
LVVAFVCLPGQANAQTVWHPVGAPTHTASGRLSPRETTCLEGTLCHVIDLRARGPADAWLEWVEEAAELNMTVWRDGTLMASSTPIGSLTQFVHVDPGRPGPWEFRVTHTRGLAPVTYRLSIWQNERLRWSLTGNGGPSVKVGQEIMVVEDGSRPLKVHIAEIRPERLVTMRDGHSREIPTTRVAKIQRGDSLRNGALIGFLVGAGFAVDRLGDCEMNCYGAFVPVLGGMGAGIGTLVDAFRRSTTLYVVP